jgi:hypothetical protein
MAKKGYAFENLIRFLSFNPVLTNWLSRRQLELNPRHVSSNNSINSSRGQGGASRGGAARRVVVVEEAAGWAGGVLGDLGKEQAAAHSQQDVVLVAGVHIVRSATSSLSEGVARLTHCLPTELRCMGALFEGPMCNL